MMLARIIPRYLKDSVHKEFTGLLRKNLHFVPALRAFFPHRPHAECYVVPKNPEKLECPDSSPLPVPPEALMSGYGPLDVFLASGRKDVDNMRNILAQSGTSIACAERILEFGCSSARMIRWLLDEVKVCEVWGTDISSSHIIWCNQYLSPPFHFVPCTVYPHLPFEDRYFGLVYAGSVFTHIDDLADTWFLELRRILRPGGRLYITIHDRNTIALLEHKDLRDSRFSQLLHSIPEYEEYVNSDFGMFTIQRSVESYVFYDLDFLRKKLEPFFRILSVTKEAYGYQSAVLLERT